MVRSRAPSEYGDRWSSPRPKAPFLKGGGGAQAPTGDCRIPAAAKGHSPFETIPPFRAGKGAKGIGRHGNALPNGLAAAAGNNPQSALTR